MERFQQQQKSVLPIVYPTSFSYEELIVFFCLSRNNLMALGKKTAAALVMSFQINLTLLHGSTRTFMIEIKKIRNQDDMISFKPRTTTSKGGRAQTPYSASWIMFEVETVEIK